jgi:parallel beta-helix repeat protein
MLANRRLRSAAGSGDSSRGGRLVRQVVCWGFVAGLGIAGLLSAPHHVASLRARLTASTAVCGTLATSTWNSAGSPYVICSSGVTVPFGATLTIDGAGGAVQVQSQGGGIAVSGGQLQTANTTSVNNASFDVQAPTTSWGGINITADASSHKGSASLSFASINHVSGSGVSISSGATSEPGSVGLALSNDSISNVSGDGVYAASTAVSVGGTSSISGAGLWGIYSVSAPGLTVGGSLTVSGSTNDGIDDYGSTAPVSITGATVSSAGGNGITVSYPGATDATTVSGNTVTGSTKVGIEVDGTTLLTLANNTLTGNGAGATKYAAVYLNGDTEDFTTAIMTNTGSGNGYDAYAFSGTVNSNLSWLTPTNSGVGHPLGYLLSGAITVSAGHTMTVHQGDVVKILGGGITLQGSVLDATDTSGPNAAKVFTSWRDTSAGLATCPSWLVTTSCTSVTTTQDWSGIAATTDSLTSDKGSAALNNTTLRNIGGNALYISSGATSAPGSPGVGLALSNDSISNVSSYGIYSSSTNVLVDGSAGGETTISNVSGQGIYVTGATAQITSSVLTSVGGTSPGQYAINLASASASSTVNCVSVHGDGSGIQTTTGQMIVNSDLYGSTGASRYDLYANGATSAQHNWWGQSGGPIAGQVGGAGPVTSSNPLTAGGCTAPPAAPAITAPTNGSTVTTNTPQILGTATPGASVALMLDGVAKGPVTADGSGNWSFTPSTALSNASHSVTATQTTTTGLISGSSATDTFSVSATLAPPTITSPVNASVVSVTTPVISGVGVGGATVTVSVDGTVIGSTPADVVGSWNLTPATGLAVGQHTVTATQSFSGSTSTASAPITFTVPSYVPLAPARVLDTRNGTGASGPVAAHGTVSLQVTGHGNVPISGVAAVVLNVTVTQPGTSGFITAYPSGQSLPTASNLNFVAGETIPGLVVVRVGPDGKVELYNGSSATVQLVADVSGYYLAGTPTLPGAFAPLAPARVLDTRIGNGASGPIAARGSVSLQIAGRGGVAASGAAAVVINVTVTQPGTSGFITAYPSGQSLPTASNLNFAGGQTISNLVVVPIGPDGKVVLYNGSDLTVQLIADVAGYYLAGTPTISGTFKPLPPSRVLDTRNGIGAATGPVATHGTVSLQMTGAGGVPSSGVRAVILNVTVTQPGTSGFVTAYPSGQSLPTASNLNFVSGETIPNLVIVPVGPDGKVELYNGSDLSVQLVADVAGYYLS